ncbi:BolA family transcriptional regulator [Candidatus Gracilibacteria bacterium]|nr:BolA family transcriptional regulator [Candidatus Gracilibacteria bacterium]
MVLEIHKALNKSFGESVMVDFKDEKNDGKHFYLDITSDLFQGLSRIEQSKLVYDCLDPFMKSGYIHALRMKCRVQNK